MSKTDLKATPAARLTAGFAAGIVAILAITGAVVGVELYGLNGITGKIVQNRADDWSARGPNASFAAVMFYRDGELRKLANLELAAGQDGSVKAIAKKLIATVDDFDARMLEILKGRGISQSQMQIGTPNLYADYENLYKEMQGVSPATIDSKFKARLATLERKMSFQIQVDAGQVADKKLKLVAKDVQTHNMSLTSELNRP